MSELSSSNAPPPRKETGDYTLDKLILPGNPGKQPLAGNPGKQPQETQGSNLLQGSNPRKPELSKPIPEFGYDFVRTALGTSAAPMPLKRRTKRSLGIRVSFGRLLRSSVFTTFLTEKAYKRAYYHPPLLRSSAARGVCLDLRSGIAA